MPQVLEITWETNTKGETNKKDINEIGGGNFNETECEVQVNTQQNIEEFNWSESLGDLNFDDEPATNVPTQCSTTNHTELETTLVTENAKDTNFIPDIGGSTHAGIEFEPEVGGSSNAPDGSDINGYNYMVPKEYVSEHKEDEESDSEQAKLDMMHSLANVI